MFIGRLFPGFVNNDKLTVNKAFITSSKIVLLILDVFCRSLNDKNQSIDLKMPPHDDPAEAKAALGEEKQLRYTTRNGNKEMIP